jgi:hypothetical protein
MLGVEFGIGITSFGLSAEILDELPEPGAIRHFAEREMEGLHKRIRFQRISESRARNELGWDQVRVLRDSNQEIEEMFQWLSYSLDNGQAKPFANFRSEAPTVDTPLSV